MCLTVNIKQQYKIAKENIVCYKVLRQLYSDVYYTPCITVKVDVDIVNGKKPLKADTNIVSLQTQETYANLYATETEKNIKGGWIHTCKLIGGAKFLAKNCDRLKLGGNYKIYECYIPKGERYYEGVDRYTGDGYASGSIVFKKEITD